MMVGKDQQEGNSTLSEKLYQAILQQLALELRQLRIRPAGGGHQITINIKAELREFDIQVLSRVAKVKV